VKRRLQRKVAQQRAPALQRQRRDVAIVQAHDVEHVIADRSRTPRHLAVEDHVADGELRNRVTDRGEVLGQPVAREQADVAAVLECEETNAIELALEDPLGIGEALLRERRGHRFDPVGKGRHGSDAQLRVDRRELAQQFGESLARHAQLGAWAVFVRCGGVRREFTSSFRRVNGT